MKIGARLFIGYGSVAICLLLLTVIALGSVAHFHDMAKRVTESEYPKTTTAAAIEHDLSIIARSMRNYILAKSEAVKEAELRKMAAAQESAVRWFTEMERLANDSQTAVAVSEIRRTGGAYLAFQQRVMELATSGRTDEASILLTEEASQHQDPLFAAIDRLTESSRYSMQEASRTLEEEYRDTAGGIVILAAVILLLGSLITFFFTRSIARNMRRVSLVMNEYAAGDMDSSVRVPYAAQDEIGLVAQSFNRMADTLQERYNESRTLSLKNEENLWIHTHLDRIIGELQQSDHVKDLSERLIRELTPAIGANCGVVYVSAADDERYELTATHAVPEESVPLLKRVLVPGDGLAGDAIRTGKRQVLDGVEARELRITTGLIERTAAAVYLFPIQSASAVEGLLEIAVRSPLSDKQDALLQQLCPRAGMLFNKAKNQQRIASLLVKSQHLTEELQQYAEELRAQQEELMQTNAELEEQTAALQQSEKQLQEKQAQLEDLNADLEEKAEEAAKAKKNLEAHAQQLLTASTYKSEFLANMSHELRTPLNSMLILAKLLSENKDGNLTEKQVEFANTMYSSGNDLLALINQILDLASIESGKMQMQTERISIRDIEAFIRKNFGPLAQQKGVELRLDVADGLPESIRTDPLRLQQILRNLLSNAFKFTDRGSVTCSIRTTKREDGVPRIAFAVADTGIGIPKEKQESVFEAFVQIDGSIRRKYGGTGLGLSISRELAGLLGGEITLESEPGAGSVFTFELPVEAEPFEQRRREELSPPETRSDSFGQASGAAPVVDVAQAQQAAVQAAARPAPPEKRVAEFAGRTILVVDDDIRNVIAISARLESYGIQVLFAEDGSVAIQTLQNHPDIDLVLMDVMMPVMDGYEAIRSIRSMPQYAALPIITVTAKAMKRDREASIEAGASDYLVKPVDSDKLLALLRVWLSAKPKK
ncbi:ATP-binding protein [Paenibacillus sp.]|uniref:ATP-binding protein n=1 Tax=Paenibacillus sp. TaxID=58172 RepID=UPI002D2A86CB|nr:ATP-binding protein [Paenibacillus sp.]HZG55677.1 ATP-binding protein [Paenibacillus sp.]